MRSRPRPSPPVKPTRLEHEAVGAAKQVDPFFLRVSATSSAACAFFFWARVCCVFTDWRNFDDWGMFGVFGVPGRVDGGALAAGGRGQVAVAAFERGLGARLVLAPRGPVPASGPGPSQASFSFFIPGLDRNLILANQKTKLKPKGLQNTTSRTPEQPQNPKPQNNPKTPNPAGPSQASKHTPDATNCTPASPS